MSLQGKTATYHRRHIRDGFRHRTGDDRKGATVIITGRDETRGASTVERSGRLGTTRSSSPLISRRRPRRGASPTQQAKSMFWSTAGLPRMMADTDEAAFDGLFQIIVKAPFFPVAALAPKIAARGGGSIFYVSTMVASYGQPGMPAYGASRAAIELLTRRGPPNTGRRTSGSTRSLPGRRRPWRSEPRLELAEGACEAQFCPAASLKYTKCPKSSRSLLPRRWLDQRGNDLCCGRPHSRAERREDDGLNRGLKCKPPQKDNPHHWRQYRPR